MSEGLTGDSTLQPQRTQGPGGFVGPYKLLGQLGEGGFGLVYEAEQAHPVKRRVALKVVKIGMDTLDFVARFEAERQVLALMDHPHIAKVLGAGANEDGRPYFVMELVKGEPIDTYCAKHKLSINDRLQLFGQVCEAVQHAHSKGIIHRDLKPSNVLVSTQDDRPFAKVIDFGIAKAMGGRVGEHTLYTEQGVLIGTPLYMSPEQAEGSVDIDTRTDIYALGAILYQLLTSTTPIESDTLRRAAQGEVQRLIREVDPPRPSTRLNRSADTLRQAADDCRMTPQRLRKTVRGELDWIVMKALEKERSRRYETANGFAADIRRYLAGEPVLAAPPSALYRSRKFIRRHKTMVGAAALILLSLLGGLLAAVWQARIAQEQTRIAQQRTAQLEQMAAFQEQMFERIDPAVAGQKLREGIVESYEQGLRRRGVAAAEIAARVEAFAANWQLVNATDQARNLIDAMFLEPAVAAIEAQFKDQPLVDAGLRQVMADRYYDFGQYGKALSLHRQALAIREQILGEDHPDTLNSLNSLAPSLHDLGRLGEAEPLYREGLARSRRVLGDDHPNTLMSLNILANLLHDQGKLQQAEPLYREGLARSRRVLGEDHPYTPLFLSNLAAMLHDQGKLDEAEPLYREALAGRRRVLGDEHPDTLVSLNRVGVLLLDQGKVDKAEPLIREGWSKRVRVLGEAHSDNLISMLALARLLNDKGEPSEVLSLMQPVESRLRDEFSESEPHWLGQGLTQLGRAHAALGEWALAEQRLTEAEATLSKHPGSDPQDYRRSVLALAALYTQRNLAEPGPQWPIQAERWRARLESFDAERRVASE